MKRIDDGSSLSVTRVRYELDDAELASIANDVITRDPTARTWQIGLNATVGILSLALAIVSYVSQSTLFVLAMPSLNAAYFLFVAGYGIWRRRQILRLPRRADLRLGDTGIVGETDGGAFTLAWRDVASARDLGELLIITLRGRSLPIGVPKRAIGEWTSLWSLLGDKLTGKRGLVVATERTLIVNTTR